MYLLLLVMVGLLAVPLAGLLAAMNDGLSVLWAALLGVVLLVVWTILTNYLGYRLISWLPADRPR